MRYPIPLLLSLTGSLFAQDEHVRYTSELLPADYPQAVDGRQWLVHRIVDDLSGVPLADAELLLIDEHTTPIAGESWFTRRATSDADGIVRIEVGDIAGAWDLAVVRKAGYGISSFQGGTDAVWRLAPAVDVPVLVRDWRGEPVGGALVGFCGGCGHTPDLANATSDPNGIAILRGIDPHNEVADLYVQREGLGLGYHSIDWLPGEMPFCCDCDPSVPMSGTLLDHLGKPIAGAFVGAPDVHRGPWTRTAADGTFRVLGMPDGWDPIAYVGDREFHFPSPLAYPATLHLPDLADPEAVFGTVDAATQPAAAPPVTVGLQVRVENGPHDARDLDVFAEYPRGPRRHQPADENEVRVPDHGPFVLLVHAEHDKRYFPFDDVAPVLSTGATLRWYSATTVTGNVRDAAGNAVPVVARLHPWRLDDDDELQPPNPPVRCADGKVTLEARCSGTVLVELVPETAALQPRLLWLVLPRRGDDRMANLGTITLAATPMLRILDANGAPLPGLRATFSRAGMQAVGDGREFPLDAQGNFCGPDLRAGDAIVALRTIDAEPTPPGADRILLPYRTVLTGDGPWEIRLPDTTLQLDVRGADDQPLASEVFVLDQQVTAPPATTLLGLPSGPLRLWVTAAGHQGAVVDTIVPAHGEKELHVRLPSR